MESPKDTQGPVALDELQNWPPTRFSNWRIRSRVCRALDWIATGCGVVLIVVSVVDSVWSWPSDYVLIGPSNLEHFAAFLLVPAWIWILASGAVLTGVRGRQMPRFPRRWIFHGRQAIILLAIALIVLVVIIVGFVIGGAKGSLRVLPGSIHQVSTLDLNNASWTTVSEHKFQVWEARFIREDAFFGYFGLFMVGFGFLIRGLRHRATNGLPQEGKDVDL